ncbi:hypothetical protein [Paenirhodobacter populi]|nr:hypothetical protein [Sinirhodobacter populi]
MESKNAKQELQMLEEKIRKFRPTLEKYSQAMGNCYFTQNNKRIDTVKWSDVMPDRKDIDSWATRIGAASVVNAVSFLPPFQGTNSYPGFAITLSTLPLLFVTMLPIISAYKKADSAQNGRFSAKAMIVMCVLILIGMLSTFIIIPIWAELAKNKPYLVFLLPQAFLLATIILYFMVKIVRRIVPKK